MPLDRIRLRLASWNFVIVGVILLVSVAGLGVSEVMEIWSEDPPGSQEAVDDESRLFTALALSGLAGLVLAGLGSAFLANRAMRPIDEAFERQRRFIADASHELRTPVAVLRARADMLARGAETSASSVADGAWQLRRDAEELTNLLEELLDLARLDAGEVPIAFEPVPLAEVAEEIVGQLRPLAEARDVRLTLAARPTWARANLAHVRQVLRALTDNALKYTPAGGRVVVSVAQERDHARLTVADTGKGIASEDLPRVVDRFYRADPARRVGGAGLGLSIAAQLIHMMHGQLRMESALGRGTQAVVLLPPARAAGERLTRPAHGRLQADRQRESTPAEPT